jgi:hypothetical protein
VRVECAKALGAVLPALPDGAHYDDVRVALRVLSSL